MFLSEGRCLAPSLFLFAFFGSDTLIETLDGLTKELGSGKLDAEQFEDIRYLADALQNGETTFAGGIMLTRTILMSNQDDEITTAISGYDAGGGVAFEAGIKNYKQSNHTSRVVINHDGSARLGEMHFNSDKEDAVKFIGRDSNGAPHEYLKLGGKAPSEAAMNDANTEIREYPLPNRSVRGQSGSFIIGQEYESIESNREIRHEFELTATAVAVAIREDFEGGGPSIMSARHSAFGPGGHRGDQVIQYLPAMANSTAHVEVNVYNRSGAVVWSDTSTKVTARAHAKGGSYSFTEVVRPEDIHDAQSQTKKVYMRIPANVMVKGYKWRVSLVISGSATHGGSYYEAHAKNGKEFVPYDKSKPFVAIAKDKIAFFFGRQRQILFNYLSNWVVKIIGNVLVQGTLKADIIEAGEWRGSGAVLAGAKFDKDGREQKSFGRYKNRQNSNTAYAFYSYNGSYYTVYHSIPHSNYVPILTVNESDWADMPSISNVNAYNFRVTFNNYKGHSDKYAFSYVAFQAT